MRYQIDGEVLAILIKAKHGNSPSPHWYRLSKSALRKLAEANPIYETAAVSQGIKIAGIAMHLDKAMFQDRAVASPLQPRISDLVDLVLALDEKGAQWAVGRLRKMAWLVKEHVKKNELVAYASSGNDSDLTNFSYAFKVLLSGAASVAREKDTDTLRKHLKRLSVRYFLTEATCSDFVEALYKLNSYTNVSGGYIEADTQVYA